MGQGKKVVGESCEGKVMLEYNYFYKEFLVLKSMVDKKDLERIILYDPKSKAKSFAINVYKHIKGIEKERGENMFILGKVNIEKFPDKEIEPMIDPNVRGRNAIFIHDASKEPFQWWVELMLINDAARRGSAEKIMNVLPYMRWSRGEKKDKPHIPIPAKDLADTISLPCLGTRADRIITLDLHASAVQGFVNIPLDHLYSYPFVIKPIVERSPKIIENLVVVGPDAGSAHRARAFAKRVSEYAREKYKRVSVGIAIIDKRRVSGEEVEVDKVVGRVRGKNCLLVDDILSSGGTLKENRIVLLQEGAKKIYAYCTHFVGSGNYMNNLKGFEKVFVTNSFYHPKNKIPKNMEVISLESLFGLAIYRAETGESISELFK